MGEKEHLKQSHQNINNWVVKMFCSNKGKTFNPISTWVWELQSVLGGRANGPLEHVYLLLLYYQYKLSSSWGDINIETIISEWWCFNIVGSISKEKKEFFEVSLKSQKVISAINQEELWPSDIFHFDYFFINILFNSWTCFWNIKVDKKTKSSDRTPSFIFFL